VTQLFLMLKISEKVQDRDMVSTDDQQETTKCGSNGHVTDDVTWPERVKVMTRNVWSSISRQPCEIVTWRQQTTNGHVTDDITW